MLKDNTVTGQLTLGFVHKAAKTSKAPGKSALKKLPRRKVDAQNHFRTAGQNGLTREELAEALRIPINSVCSVALAMLADGSIVDSGRTRATHSGYPAAILIAANLAGSCCNG